MGTTFGVKSSQGCPPPSPSYPSGSLIMFDMYGIDAFLTNELLIGIPIGKIKVMHAGTEQITANNVDINNYDITTGTIPFIYPLGGDPDLITSVIAEKT